jgi:hypothetical protein
MVDIKREIEISIGPEGDVHISTKGVRGKACLELVKFLEESLGEVTDRKLKPEYYEQEVHISGSATPGHPTERPRIR